MMNFRPPRFALLVLSLLLAGLPAFADDDADENARDKEDRTYISVAIENDNFGGNSDRYYTSGVRFSWFNANIHVPPVIDEMADAVPTFDLNESTSVYYSLGHNMYTPKDITIEENQDDDRPWAAFLYGSVGMATVTFDDGEPHHVDDLEFTLGVVGPEALGKPIQRAVHQYITPESPDPRGWKNQLDFEPGVMVSWRRRFPFVWKYESDYFGARLEPNFSVTLGNIYTHAGTGATIVIGSSINEDTPQRVRPAIPGTGVFGNGEDEFHWQFFVGIDGRVVGRNIFLDGNTFSDSHSVDKKHFVGDASVGVSFTYDDYRLSYTLNARSKEFDVQDEESIFGSVALSYRF